jgi:hypothetical protein
MTDSMGISAGPNDCGHAGGEIPIAHHIGKEHR